MGLESQFICADFSIASDEDMSLLVDELKALGLYGGQQFYESWYANFASPESGSAETSVLGTIKRLEKLSTGAKAMLARCSRRELSLGFNSGLSPFALEERISAKTLKRAADLGLAIEITLYQFTAEDLPQMFYEWTTPKELDIPQFGVHSTKARYPLGDGGVDEQHLRRVKMLRKRIRRPNLKVLDLTGGDGQTIAATAKAGHQVTAIELSLKRVEKAQALLAEQGLSADIHHGDLYEGVDLGTGFDAIFYWSGFGAGSDGQQRHLLRRAADEWLADERSRMFVQVFDPPWWAKQSPRARTSSYGTYDAAYAYKRSRLIERWWPREEGAACMIPGATPRATRGLRCYSEADFNLLLEGTGLKIHGIELAESDHCFLAVLAKESARRPKRA